MRLTAFFLLSALLLCAVAVTVHAPFRYSDQDRANISSPSSSVHPAGTDELGRDRMLRVASALLLGLAGAALAAALATGIAVGAGACAAFGPPGIRSIVLYLSDAALTLPWLFLLMMVRGALPLNLAPAHSALLTFVLLGLLGWPAFVRMNHARAAALRNAGWMFHGRASGLRAAQLARHLIPHFAPLLLTQFLIYVPVAVVAEANLGAMGLGVSEPLPSWGGMLLALQSAALMTPSAWNILPIAMLVGVLLLLEMLLFEVKS